VQSSGDGNQTRELIAKLLASLRLERDQLEKSIALLERLLRRKKAIYRSTNKLAEIDPTVQDKERPA
jgi:hypothetical protein